MGGRKPLWTPSEHRVKQANLTHFINFVNKTYGLKIQAYDDLYQWSVEKIPEFWSAVWDFSGIICSRRFDKIVDDLQKFPGATWFQGARLNYAENLLRHDDGIALTATDETGRSTQMSYSELRTKAGRVAEWLRSVGIGPGDRVGGYLPNISEAAIAMLGATTIGAVWACCGAELGPAAAIERLGQVEPKALFAADGYVYKGKNFNLTSNVEKVAKGISSIRNLISISNLESQVDRIPDSTPFEELVTSNYPGAVRFEQLPADHPLFIMFTSGTTGRPKCMVQGAAGVLVNQIKELMLHADLRTSDRVMYITSPSWMMWNWLMSGLALGASIVLYDGNPNYPDWGAMWRLVEKEKLTFLGCSASYLNHLRSIGARPGEAYDLSSLREISQTASPLSTEGFEWVYREVKDDFHFNSISGGTDINGCFAGGVPTLPVYAGELQAPGLGMKINVYDENGNPLRDAMGELVCEAPTPSMPICFWNDVDQRKYLDAYFEYFHPMRRRVWRHGDYVMIHSDTGGITFYGRSDAVIKASGVRVGTSEIYNVLEKMPEIADSLAVGQNWKDDQRIILFVKLAPGEHLSKELEERIRASLRKQASPKHVPDLIFQVPDIPYTFNMKKVETAVTNIVNNRPVTNRGALANPESLDFYATLLPLLNSN